MKTVEPSSSVPASAARVLADYEMRRLWLLERAVAAGEKAASDHFALHALFALVAGGDAVAANLRIRRCSAWFDLPAEPGVTHEGEGDFAALKLCRAWHLFAADPRLEPETLAAIRRFFLTHDFSSIYQSENHALIFHTSRCLMAQVYGADVFAAYGKTGAQLVAEDEVWLVRFLRYRAACGWGEFDSACYFGPVWECLACLHDFSASAELRRLVGMMMNLLLADMAVDSLDGLYCGAHGRIYPPHALDHATEPTRVLQYLYFGGREPTRTIAHGFMLDALTCGWRPDEVVVDIALNRPAAYENRERKHLHNLADVLPVEPLAGSIRKYTFVTPAYALGCVQLQDAYPSACAHHPHSEIPVRADQRITAGYAHHQQHQWDFSAGVRTDARIFTHHPGKSGAHNHWTGDHGCGCGHFFQNRQALIAVYDIPDGQACEFIHAYVPRAAFDEIVEEAGWIFVRSGDVFAGLWLSSGYRWTEDGEWAGLEIIGEGRRHGVVCEAGMRADFGDFTGFRSTLIAHPAAFDRDAMTLRHRSTQAGSLYLDTTGGRRIDDVAADLDYAAWDSPFIRSAWRSGVVELIGSSGRLTLDFPQT